jgi:hypothetical protein
MAPTLLWFSGLELGTVAEFNQSSSGVIETGIVRSGTYSIKFDNELHTAAVVQVPGLSATLFGRFQFYPTGAPLESNSRIYGAGVSTGRFRLYYTPAGKLLWNYNGTDYDTGADSVVLNDWNRIEFKQVRDATVGGMEVYLNGVFQFSRFNVNTTTGSSATDMRFFVGPTNGSMGSTAGGFIDGADTYFDDIAIATGEYIGDGQCVVVGGQAGTPTYDAWAKSAGSDAYALWSDIPASATTYCSEATLNDQQTMLVANLGAVGGTATILGARVVAHAKTSAGSTTVKLLRRIAGADTLSAALILGTTSRLVPDGVNGETYDVFTDTPANLAAAEIGARDNDGAVTTTVNDVYLMIDFIPGPPVTLTLALPTPLEALGWVALALPTPLEALGQTLLELALGSPLEACGWIRVGVPLPVESWVAFRRLWGIPVEIDGEPAASLGVAFTVITPAYGPFMVTFDVFLLEEDMGALTVQFDVLVVNDAGLVVTFFALPETLYNLRMQSALQAPHIEVRL